MFNTTSSDNVVFTDNIQKSFNNYNPSELPQFSGINAKKEATYLKGRMALYQQRVNQLRLEYYQSRSIPVEKQKEIKSLNFAFKTYFHVHLDYCKAQLDGGGSLASKRGYIMSERWLTEKIKNCTEQKEVFNCINRLSYLEFFLFGDLSSFWDIRFSYTILEQIQSLDQDQMDALFYYIALVRRGLLFLHPHIGSNQKHQNWVLDPDLAYCVIFCEAFSEKNAIVGAVMPIRVPEVNSEGGLLKLSYSQYILFTEFTKFNKILGQKNKYKEHKQFLLEDDDLYKCFQFELTNLRYDRPQNELQVAVQFKRLFEGDIITYQIKPLKIFSWMLKEPSLSSFSFDSVKRRWVYTHTQAKDIAVQHQKEKNLQENIITRLDKEEEQDKLILILDQLPTIKIKLSLLQKQVVGSASNLLCLGRSGTGKTTTTVLRLFSQELLYKLFKKQKKNELEEIKSSGEGQPGEEQKNKKYKAVLHSSDIDQLTGMKMVFITASPVLTNEVRRFYSSLKQNLKEHLKRKEDRQKEMQEKREEEKQNFEKIDKEEEPIVTETIEDQEKKELLDFIQREEKELIEDIQLDNSLNIPNSFEEVGPQHFPLFSTVKRLVYMMDASLSFSFFSRDYKNNIIGLDSNLGWHNESKGVMMINHYYKENIDYNDQLAKFGKEIMDMDKEIQVGEDNYKDLGDNFVISEEHLKQDDFSFQNTKYRYQYSNRINDKYILERQQLSFEVDYDTFELRFWPKIIMRKNLKKISPTLVWTEIYSVIKGGVDSQYYYMGYLPRQQYIYHGASEFLNINERKTIYYIFLEYEKWKYEHHAYDFMDVVNHVIKRLYYGDTLRRMGIDYLMVDEVQDLTPKTLQLLLRLTKHRVFFAGDTAQTIAKGVGARFHDLRSIFSTLSGDVPKIVQLTRNYRSHGRILDLANSVVSLIELFFPKTIDRLVKEESDLDGMKPLVIMPLDPRNLKNLFLGASISGSQSQNMTSPQFGCNQVLIVRDQQAKENIPDLFKNMLCLSVYESKGLEFDDVILYNFFHLGDVSKSQWKLLNDIVFEQVRRVKYTEEILDFDSLDVENFENLKKMIKAQEEEDEAEYEFETQITTKQQREEIYRKFSMLCIELKFLYVAITRPKKRLIIYDDVSEGRKPIQAYWEALGAIKVITKEMMTEEGRSKMSPDIREIFEAGALKGETSTEVEWRIQGIKLFKKKYYDAAIKCFTFSGDNDLVQRCNAYQEAELGSAKLTESEGKIWRSKVMQLQKMDKRKLIKEAKKLRAQANQNFQKAGMHFNQIDMKKHAASCYFTGRNYLQAAEIFEQLEHYGQAAECLLMEEQYVKAARLFEKAKLISKSIECYELSGDWESLLHCLHRNKDFFKAEERESLVNKYVPVALNSLYRLYSQMGEGNEELDEENKGKLQELKMKMKYQKKVDVIMEEEELSEDSNQDEEEDEQEEVEETQNQDQNEQEDEENKQEGEEEDMVDVIMDSEEEEDPGLLEEVFQIKRQKSEQEQKEKEKEEKKEQNQSFEIIDKEEAEKDIDEQEGKLEDFEHLSQYDPDDEFLRSSNSVSIIESIISQKSISKTSDFSIISTPKSKAGSAISIITTNSKKSGNQLAQVHSNRDIYAEDVITQKIIYYVSLFSEEVSDHLKKLRSNKVLTHNKEDKQIPEQDFLIDLDEADSSFINLILDVLEYYELFRLCLMICNRYHMSDRIGRYIISVCSKYSNLNLFKSNFNFNSKQTHVIMKWFERQRHASILAHEAIHNVFTLIEPKFLSLKDIGEKVNMDNSLSVETYRMMLDLGFWKKLVYISNGRTALELCKMFFNRENFLILKEHLSFDRLDQSELSTLEEELAIKECQIELFDKKIINPSLPLVRNNLKQLYEQYKEDSHTQIIQNILKVNQWLYGKKTYELSTKEQMKGDFKQEETFYNKLDQESTEITNIFVDALKNPTNLFSQFIIMQLTLTIQTQYFTPLMNTIKEYFETQSIKALLENFVQVIKLFNLDQNTKFNSEQKRNVKTALYTTYLISQFSDNLKEEDMNLFKDYQQSYLLVNINSPLIKDIQILQSAFNNVGLNKYLEEQMKELRSKYFKVKNFQTAVIRQFKEFQQSKYLLLISIDTLKVGQFDSKLEKAFFIDMDAQFMVVPKIWVDKLLLIKLLNLTLQLESTLRQCMRMRNEDNTEALEDRANQISNEIQILNKVKIQILKSIEIHQKYAQTLIQQSQDKYQTLLRREEFQYIVKSYWQKVSFQPINFDSIQRATEKVKILTFYEFQNQLNLSFSLGFNHQPRPLTSVNGLLNQAFELFNSAFDNFSAQFLRRAESVDEFGTEVIEKQHMLKTLMKSFSFFMVTGNYEYMAELIKYKRREMESNAMQYQGYQIEYLKKFMIALDVYVYLRNGCWQLAIDSIFSLLNYFYPILDYGDRVDLIEQAFYLSLILKYDKVYVPDNAQKIVKIDSMDNIKVAYENIEELGHRQPFEIICEEIKIEKSDKETGYNEALYWVNKVLEQANEDDYAPALENSYKKLYNILMSSTVNDQKKSQKTIDQLVKGYSLILKSPFEDYFLGILQEYEVHSASGIHNIAKDFTEWEITQIYQFFASDDQTYGGYLTHIDTSKRKIINVEKTLNTLFIKESQIMAKHLILNHKLTKLYKQKRLINLVSPLTQIDYQTKCLAQSLNLEKILQVKQLPGLKLISLLRDINLKQIQLKQLVVSKYATNSLDIHYIIEKAMLCEQIATNLITKFSEQYQKKGEILKEFVGLNQEGLEDEDKECKDLIAETVNKLVEIEDEVNIWMNKKAEPNLIEVEIKSQKYKLKWESLNLFDKKQQLKNLLLKKKIIEQKN